MKSVEHKTEKISSIKAISGAEDRIDAGRFRYRDVYEQIQDIPTYKRLAAKTHVKGEESHHETARGAMRPVR